jgi:hypothetical protein
VLRAVGIMSGMLLLAGCDSGPPDEEIVAAVEGAFAAANPPGRTGTLMKGRDGVVWWQTSAFDGACLEKNDLAFNDDPTSRPANAQGIPRISPTHLNQWAITAATDTGYCIDLGADPAVSVGEVTKSGEGYRVVATVSMATPTKWFECLRSDHRDRVVQIAVDEAGAPVVETDMSLLQGDCPHPIPASKPRTSRPEPTTAAPAPPTASQIQALAAEFDAALAGRDGAAARALVSCYNLYEPKPYGACALIEVIAHGSVTADEANPWLEYAARDFSVLTAATRDKLNPSIYHVPFKHRRSGDTRSISVQWADGRWKLLGVVSRRSAKLTAARILNDLHRRDKRDILARRLAGEQIDEAGLSLDPNAEEQP